VQQLADSLMGAVGRIVPVVPVSLVAAVFAADPQAALSGLELKARLQEQIEALEARGAQIYVPRQSREYAIEVGLRMLTLRHLITERQGLYRVNPANRAVLEYYANAIDHL
jgi:glycerol-3-phosphate O-acyltransferase